mmetsp:Transcript_39975/g.119062  ORF Transcript_39975/g.119062 Transcript_39975/m.119062 type:complete len:226 (-) Transcript_39975:926-1603(-)
MPPRWTSPKAGTTPGQPPTQRQGPPTAGQTQTRTQGQGPPTPGQTQAACTGVELTRLCTPAGALTRPGPRHPPCARRGCCRRRRSLPHPRLHRRPPRRPGPLRRRPRPPGSAPTPTPRSPRSCRHRSRCCRAAAGRAVGCARAGRSSREDPARPRPEAARCPQPAPPCMLGRPWQWPPPAVAHACAGGSPCSGCAAASAGSAAAGRRPAPSRCQRSSTLPGAPAR